MLVRRRRPFVLEVELFGGDRREVTVLTAERARSFTEAAIATGDPDNVYRATLLADDGRPLEEDETAGGVPVDDGPRPHLNTLYPPPRRWTWAYFYGVSLFGGVDTEFGLHAPDRGHGFTAAAVYSATANDVRTVWLTAIQNRDMKKVWKTDPAQPYGGVYEFKEGKR